MLRESLYEVLIFPIAQPIQRLDLWSVIGSTRGQRDAPSRQEASDTCLSRPTVDVLLVVDDRVERDEGGALCTGSTLQVIIEQSLPGTGVDAGRTRDHAVQVEEESLEFAKVDVLRRHYHSSLGERL
jgi:hypothetical protein